MDDEISEEFNERFATIEETIKYIADSQAKAEFIHKREIAEIRALQEKTSQNLDRTQRHLDHITKVLRFNIEEYEFQEDKLTEAGEILSRKRNK